MTRTIKSRVTLIAACLLISARSLPAADTVPGRGPSPSRLDHRRFDIEMLPSGATMGGNFVEVSQFNDDITNPVDRWNIADRTDDEEMGAALDYMLEEIARKPGASLRDLESDEALCRERNEIAFDKFIEVLWYSKNMELKKKVVQVWAQIDNWPRVERMFQQSGSEMTSEKILFALAHLRNEVRHSRYHFDSDFVGKLETIERKIQQAPSDLPGQS